MKKISLIISYIMALCCTPVFAQNDTIDCCANCDMSCVHYERYSLHCVVYHKSYRLYFFFADACAEKHLEEIPVLDSIWITTLDDQETILFKSYNQVGDTLDVSSLEVNYHGYYLLHAQLGNCVKRRRFTLRGFPSDVDNTATENSDKNAQKILRDGNLLIKHEDNIFTVQGLRLSH